MVTLVKHEAALMGERAIGRRNTGRAVGHVLRCQGCEDADETSQEEGHVG
jgi:predicted RNA-binding Zn-ribbon protein involved in translation (DUF1610 family)